LVVLGFFLSSMEYAPRAPQLWPVGDASAGRWKAVIVAGILFAWWARIHLGKLWSGGIERMAEHRVVDSGPYALVRHPIYTGLIVRGVRHGGDPRRRRGTLLGAGLFALGFALKAKVEERFLEAELGGYDAYRARVPMIVPFVADLR
jgi:protein-S-isoprenylcysteine O-methyltransferase Ste14